VGPAEVMHQLLSCL